MDFKEFLLKYSSIMKILHENILKFLENDDDNEGNIEFFIQYINNHKINQNKWELKSLLRLISNISNNHYRSPDFFNKINQILKIFKGNIIKFFSNYTIFNIFKSKQRIILILLEEKIIQPEYQIFSKMKNGKYKTRHYPEYFYIEFKSFFSEKLKNEIDFDNIENDENKYKTFLQKRQKGENDSYICELIRNDSVQEFISYINNKNIPFTSTIPNSLFETISIFLKNPPTLIEYAAFYGSIQIFNFLRLNNVELELSLWSYSIYSHNPELIHFLEENSDESSRAVNYEFSYQESIKCHRIDFMNYFKDNIDQINVNQKNIFKKNIHHYNFIDLNNQIENNLFDVNKYMLPTMDEMIQYKDINPLSLFAAYDWISVVDFYFKNIEQKMTLIIEWILI